MPPNHNLRFADGASSCAVCNARIKSSSPVFKPIFCASHNPHIALALPIASLHPIPSIYALFSSYRSRVVDYLVQIFHCHGTEKSQGELEWCPEPQSPDSSFNRPGHNCDSSCDASRRAFQPQSRPDRSIWVSFNSFFVSITRIGNFPRRVSLSRTRVAASTHSSASRN